jgi:hypothetical protein
MAPRPAETTKKDTVADNCLRANDVLFGRGSGPSQYEGNRRFRSIVWETLQEYLQRQQAKNCGRGEAVYSGNLFPPTITTATKSGLCRIVREKITRMNGRFLQKVTGCSAARVKDADCCLVCVTHIEDSKNKDGKGPHLKTYFKIAEEKLVLNKIKQTLRFLLDQKFGRKEGADLLRVAGDSFVGDERSGGPILASAAMPVGILSQGQTYADALPALPNDNVARLLSAWQALPSPPLVIPLALHDATTLDMLTSAQILIILQQRQQQRRQENERAVALLQLLQSIGDRGMAPTARYASLEQQVLAISMASSHGGLSGHLHK